MKVEVTEPAFSASGYVWWGSTTHLRDHKPDGDQTQRHAEQPGTYVSHNTSPSKAQATGETQHGYSLTQRDSHLQQDRQRDDHRANRHPHAR